jgi:hypothetical protein
MRRHATLGRADSTPGEMIPQVQPMFVRLTWPRPTGTSRLLASVVKLRRLARLWLNPQTLLGGYKAVVSPPSMTKSAPVTFPARLLASSRTRSATSWGWVNRPVTESLAA